MGKVSEKAKPEKRIYRKIAAALVLLFLLGCGYLQETYVINLFNSDYPLLLRRSWVYLSLDQLKTDPRWVSTLIYFLIFSLGGSFFTGLWSKKIWGIYAFVAYLFLAALSLTFAVAYDSLQIPSFIAIARSIKSFYLSIAFPLLWVLAYWYGQKEKK